MKITLNNINYRSDITKTRPIAATESIPENSGNFDEITIHSDSRQIAEKTFSEALSKTVSAQVREEVPEYKINLLRTQVRNGTYEMDPDIIASRILLFGGGSSNA